MFFISGFYYRLPEKERLAHLVGGSTETGEVAELCSEILPEGC